MFEIVKEYVEFIATIVAILVGLATLAVFWIRHRKGKKQELDVASNFDAQLSPLVSRIEEHGKEINDLKDENAATNEKLIRSKKFEAFFKALNNKRHDEALGIIKPMAESGDAMAQNNLAAMYQYGQGVVQSDEKAAEWIYKVAEQGFANAQNILGAIYCNGDGVERNYKEGIFWFSKAAEQGYAEAQHNLGIIYYNGLGGVKDYELASAWVFIAKANGNEDAIKFLEDASKGITNEIRLQSQKRADKMIEENPLLLQSNPEQ